MSTLDAATVKHLLRHGAQISEEDIASVDGLPEELLHDALKELHYRQDTLRGYRPLKSWFMAHPPEAPSTRNFLSGPWQPWHLMYLESGMGDEYSHTLLVADLWMRNHPDPLPWFPVVESEKDRYPGEGTKRHGRIRVYLTRRTDSFIVWASWPESTFVKNLGPQQVAEVVNDLTPKYASLYESHSRGTGTTSEQIDVVHPALSIVRGIEIAIESSFLNKRKDADIEERAYKSLKRRSGIYIPSVPV